MYIYTISYLSQNKQLYYESYCYKFNKLLTIVFALQIAKLVN